MRELRSQIPTDALTGLLSRHAYALVPSSLVKTRPEEGFAVFSIDVNGFKEANDTLGHDAGDELLRGAAQCLQESFDESANVYRVCGDGYVVFAQNMGERGARDMVDDIRERAVRWHGEVVDHLSMSVGFALATGEEGPTCEESVYAADQAMRADKTTFYAQPGHDRCRPR